MVLTRGESWPLFIVIKKREEHRSYRPKSDFSAFGSSLPRLLIEVNSTLKNQVQHDRIRMLLQAASIVRFANQRLERYRTDKSFVLVAAYIGHDGEVQRYILFQDKQNGHDVCCVFQRSYMPDLILIIRRFISQERCLR
jgi:hypothetical protein